MSFEQIKDTSQLQEYLQKHLTSGSMTIKNRDASPLANEYMSRQQKQKLQQKASNGGQSVGGTALDRYEKGIAKRTGTGNTLEEAKDKANAQNDI